MRNVSLKPFAFLVILLVILVVAMVFVWKKQVSPQPELGFGSIKPVLTLFDQEMEGKFDDGVWRFNAEFDNITASAVLPNVSPMLAIALRDEVQDIFEEFERLEEQANCTDAELKGSAQCASHSISVVVKEVDNGPLASFVMSSGMYIGGAHDMYQEQGIVLDKGGRRLGVDNIFRGAYLEVLSDIARQQLTQKFNLVYEDKGEMQEELLAGTEPDAENFRFFYIDRGLVFVILNPYQVAPWAAGVQYVVVPLKDLQGYIQPEIMNLYADVVAPSIVMLGTTANAEAFSVEGYARTFESNVPMTLSHDGKVLVATATTALAPEMGMYGYFQKIIPLTPYNLKEGDEVKWDVFDSSAKDGSDIIRYTGTFRIPQN